MALQDTLSGLLSFAEQGATAAGNIIGAINTTKNDGAKELAEAKQQLEAEQAETTKKAQAQISTNLRWGLIIAALLGGALILGLFLKRK